MERPFACLTRSVTFGAVASMVRVLVALLVLAACVAHDVPRCSASDRAPASVRAADGHDLDVEETPQAIAAARAAAPRTIPLPAPRVRWLPSRVSLSGARSARARSRRAMMRARMRRPRPADPDDF